VHATSPNQVLRYDYLYTQKKLNSSNQPIEYVLVLKDDISGFVEMILALTADHFVVTDTF
jgi:hypothetical protein